MERNFTNENFERFLRQNADGLRMRPSDKVWKGVSRHLNRKRRRFGFLLGVSLLLTTGLGYYFTQPQQKTTVQSGINKNNSEISSPSPSVKQNTNSEQRLGINKDNSVSSKGVQNSPISYSLVSALVPGIVSNPELSAETASSEPVPDPDFKTTIIDEYPGVTASSENKDHSEISRLLTYPMTIESVLNSYKAKKSRIGLQIYFTPTVSYRKMSDNNIDNYVTHKPDFGFELGLAAKYKLNRNIKIRGGFQFNVNRYEIKTFNSNTQLATIRLSNRNGFDSFSTATNYNNFAGYQANWLENFYFSMAAPVGVEVKLRGDDKVQFGIASTIQPTYVLGDRAYLISTDYKNYAEVPRLVRRWNVNTSLETFVSYSTGRLKWQVGPQVRYQLLSSYVKKYPVKENLFDFGLKVGISLNNQ